MKISNIMKIKTGIDPDTFEDVKISYIEPNYCTAEGKNTIATGEAAHAEGYGAYATLFNSITLAPYNIENNQRNFILEKGSSVSKGTILLILNEATNVYETRKVVNRKTVNISSESRTHIELNKDLSYDSVNERITAYIQRSNGALGNYSHTEGQNTLSLGKGSHAEGIGTFTIDDYQHVQGKYNDDPTGYLHVVGKGTTINQRSNAHTLDWDGNAWFAGDITLGQNNSKLTQIDLLWSELDLTTEDELIAEWGPASEGNTERTGMTIKGQVSDYSGFLVVGSYNAEYLTPAGFCFIPVVDNIAYGRLNIAWGGIVSRSIKIENLADENNYMSLTFGSGGVYGTYGYNASITKYDFVAIPRAIYGIKNINNKLL